MGETLIAVGILLILAAIAIPATISIRKNMRQTELDAKAEMIYVAAQNQMTRLRTGGFAELYAAANATVLNQRDNQIPSDQEPEHDENGNVKVDAEGRDVYKSLCYTVRGDAAADVIMTADTVESDLLDHAWVIEYDPELGTVYAVFYSEEIDDLAGEYVSQWSRYNTLRAKARRQEDGAKVGYYGGNFSTTATATSTLTPTLTVSNGETLTALMQCSVPAGAEVTFKLTLEDEFGHSYTESYSNMLPFYDPMHLDRRGQSVYRQITLDDLSDAALRFVNLYGSGSGHPAGQQITAGSALTLAVSSPDRTLQRGPSATVTTNSLFADGSSYDTAGRTLSAEILCGRHLQNLDSSSGLALTTYAKQLVDLSFSENKMNTSGTDWFSLYSRSGTYFNGQTGGEANFKPIRNAGLRQYDGGDCTVAGLRVSGAEYGGLFAVLSGGAEVKNLTLTGVRIEGETVGALAGAAGDGDNTVRGCRVYLTPSDRSIAIKDDPDPWILGQTTGGLVGTVGIDGASDGSAVTIIDSFAATVLRGTERCGGLVGEVLSGGRLKVETSYADCYLYGAHTGGLSAGGEAASVTDSYAAGFQMATETAAGLINGTLQYGKRSYTICDMTASSATRIYTTAASVASAGQVYYFPHNNGMNAASTAPVPGTSEDLREQLGEKFTTSTGNTMAYNLRGQSLRAYTYPRLEVNRHYGDWKAEFQTGSLVYYEKYNDGTYGFFGANVNSTLKETGVVVGDGYGIVFRFDGDAVPTSITVTIDEAPNETAAEVDTSVRYPVREGGVDKYMIVPLPREIVNKDPVKAGFYRRVEIHSEAVGTESTDLYYFNPHFAQTAVLSEDEPRLYSGDTVVVRTPRHLYAMSRYYDTYLSAATSVCSFIQRRNISFSGYDWSGFYRAAPSAAADRWISGSGSSYVISAQLPIGRDAAHPFQASYNGNCFQISDVSFISIDGDYVGMFGFNRGTVSNVALVTDYQADQTNASFYVKREADISINESVYMGILAGSNAGVIYNCATAGYYIAGSDGTLHSYANSSLYVGGLVGENNGSVQNSAADCPAIRVSSLNATVDIGGFVGWNRDGGSVSNCYDLGHVEVAFAQGGEVRVSGFAGRNDGRIQQSYCATSLMTSGATASSYSFAPDGGLVQSSYYLDKGTYLYAGVLRSYGSGGAATSGTGATYLDLQNMQGTARPTAANSISHPNTTESRYPYRAVVRNASGELVHYGDWQNVPVLGTLGVFYWEHEEHGTNDGYHITYIGTVEGSQTSGTTLCTAHDDGGEITEFGYGYYVQVGQEEQVSLSSSGIAYGAGEWNRTVAKALNEQLVQYTFYPYTTGFGTESDYLYLSDQTGKSAGIWTLTFNGPQGVKTYRYAITPFFANALQRLDAYRDIILTASDLAETNYKLAPGSEGNVYEIRSARQLQYINWNNETYGTGAMETGSTARHFPFLQYATRFGDNEQPKYVDEVFLERPVQYWKQTHDVQASGIARFTPIAGAGESSTVNDWRAMIYGWFGGSFDGQSYKIQNLNVVSDCYSVGVFGITVGANIRDVILYGDGTTRVERRTKDFNTGVGETIGAYTLGGLIGTAFDYADDSDNVISNCAIAGYQIIDNSTNQQGNGGANIGGLIGVASLNLEKCSAVTEIHINCTHDNGTAQYGSYVCAGGLAGSANRRVTDCYTGGSIEVAKETLDEVYLGRNKVSPDYDGEVKRNDNTHIYIAGVTANTNRSRYTNFTSSSAGKVTVTNCYTYVTLPDMEGCIRGVSLISGAGDRYSDPKAVVTVNNCYYLQGIEEIEFRQPKYYFKERTMVEGDTYRNYVFTDEDKTNILNGDLTINAYLINFDDTYENWPLGDTPTGKSFDELQDASMIGLLSGSGWGWVTTTEGSGTRIDGKYSFSSGAQASAQAGKNYPFPTIVTQKDTIYSTKDHPVYVNVHYGAWPSSRYFWTDGRAAMDIFGDMKLTAEGVPEGEGYAEKTFQFCYQSDVTPQITFSPEGIVELVGAPVKDAENSCYLVTLRALSDGSVIVTEAVTDTSFSLSITHRLTLKSEPEPSAAEPMMLYQRTPEPMTLFSAATAQPAESRSYFSLAGTWSLAEAEPEDGVTLVAAAQDPDDPVVNEWTLEGYEPGRRSMTAVYTYNYHGKEYSQVLHIPTWTLGSVGLSAGTQRSEALRMKTGTAGGTEQVGALAGAPAGPELLLYASAADGDLESFAIREITVRPENGEEQVIYRDGAFQSGTDYTVSFRTRDTDDGARLVCEDAEEGAAYRFCAGLIRRGDGAADTGVTVTVELEDPNGAALYRLTVPVDSVPRYNVHFEPDGGSGRMFDEGVDGDSYTLPDCRFARTGYSFDGWLVNDAVDALAAGETVELTADLTLRAVWRAHSYTVRLMANGGEGEMEEQTFRYDVEARLAKNAFTGAEGFPAFSGWNTQIDGSGTAYADEALLLNLTDEDGGEILLYAQWGAQNHLTLRIAEEEEPFAHWTIESMNGRTAAEIAPDARLTVTGWTLDGWYTEASVAGVKVLNADGSIAAEGRNLTGYTDGGAFELTGDKALYACWTRTAYGQVDALVKSGSANGSGTYLIVSDCTSGTRKALTEAAFEDGLIVSNSHVKVVETPIVNADGSEGNGYIETAPEKAEWLADYRSTEVLEDSMLNAARPEQTRADLYTLQNGKYGGYLFSANSEGVLSLADVGTDNNARWTYGQKFAHGLQTRTNVRSSNLRMVGWSESGLRWETGAGEKAIYFYRWETIRSFQPVETEPLYTIDFDPNGGMGFMADELTVGGSYTLPECGYTRTSYLFQGWRIDGSETLRSPGDTISVQDNVSLTAQWAEHKYTVRFLPNGGTGAETTQSIAYDVSRRLTEVTELGFTGPDGTPYFTGWNTEADGTGTRYADGAYVMNLTSENGATVTLYAQWSDVSSNTLTLISGSFSLLTTPAGSQVTVTMAERTDGWVLDGWYTEKSASGVRVLDADGSVCADVAGYTSGGVFDLIGDRILYARWTKEAYAQVDALERRSDEDTGNGTYLIVDDYRAGTRNALTALNETNKSDALNTAVTVLGVSVIDGSGTERPTYVDSPNAKAVWTVNYLWTVSLSGTAINPAKPEQATVDIYTIRSPKGLYLRYDTSKLTVRTDLDYNGSPNNKHIWTYGQKFDYQLMCQHRATHADNNTTDYAVFYNGANWRSDAAGIQVYMFRYQTIYAFDLPEE